MIGSGIGLGLGAAFLVAGMAGHAADYAHAQRIAEAAATGYASSHLDAQGQGQGQGLRVGRARYALQLTGDMRPSAVPGFTSERAQVKGRRRADLECLTEAVYYEARGESARGQAAVAQVVMNRVKHPAFPKSVCGVVFQGAGRRSCQFSFACDGSMRRAREAQAWARARRVATRALAGAALADIGSATHFHTTAVAPVWAPQMLRVAMVGTHVFYKFSPYRARGRAAPFTETAVLTGAPASDVQQLRLEPALVEKAVEASLQPTADETTAAAAKPASTPAAAPAAKPAEAAALSSPQPMSATAS